MQKTRGFGLLEVCISVAIIGVAIILVIGMFTLGINAMRKSVDVTAATAVAQQRIEEVRQAVQNAARQGYTPPEVNAPGAPDALTSPSQGNDSFNNTDYFWDRKVTVVFSDGFGWVMLQVSVTVKWFVADKDQPALPKAGYGNHFVTLSTIVYRK